MFDETSRYKDLPVAVHTDPRGVEHAYVTQRYLPDPARLTVVARVPVQPGDRLDIVAHRIYGASDQYWRLADAALTSEPERLTDVSGTLLKAPLALSAGDRRD